MNGQWIETYNFPENGYGNLYFFDESEGIVLQNDNIYKTYDSGETWSLVESFPSSYFFWHQDFFVDTGIIVGSMPNQGLYTTDRGENWVELFPADISYNHVNLLNGHEYYKTPISDPHFVYCNIDKGVCEDTIIAPGILLMNAIEIIDKDTMYVCTSSTDPATGLYKTINAGEDWQPIDVDNLAYLDFPTSRVGYGMALDYVIKTNNFGNEWTTIILDDTIAALGHPFFVKEEVGFVAYKSASENFGILKTTDGLTTLTLTQFPSEENEFHSDGINSVFCLDELNCWCVTNYGRIFKTTNGGEGGVVLNTDVSIYGNDTSDFWITPNPATDIINIHSTLNLIADLSFCDIFGRNYEVVLNDNNGSVLTIDISNLPTGVYYITLNSIKTAYKIVKL